MIGYGEKQAVLYHGDHKPAELYGPQEHPAVFFNQWITSQNEYKTSKGIHLNSRYKNIPFYRDHKYYVYAEAYETDGNPFSYCSIGWWIMSETKYYRWNSIKYVNNIFEAVFTPRIACAGNLEPQLVDGETYDFVFQYIGDNSANSDIMSRRMMLIDLTEMFGAGNEPQTAQAFRKYYPDNYYMFSQGEWQVAPKGVLTAYTHTFTGRFAGWKEVEVCGKEIVAEDTYDDRLDLTVYGRHEQHTQEETSHGFFGTEISVDVEQDTYLKSVVFSGQHHQTTTHGMQLFDLKSVNLAVGSNRMVVEKTQNGILINCEALSSAGYVFMLNSEVGLQPGKTYTSRTKVSYRAIAPGGGTAGSMLYVWYLQTNTNFDSSGAKKYQVFGKSYFNQNGVCYSTFTLPEDLTGYDYIVTRVTGYSEILFEDMQLVEGSYDASNFPEFEAYTGGKPSPNPSHPQVVVPVQKECLTIHGKNLIGFPDTDEYVKYYHTNYSELFEEIKKLTVGRTYTFSARYYARSGSAAYFQYVFGDGTVLRLATQKNRDQEEYVSTTFVMPDLSGKELTYGIIYFGSSDELETPGYIKDIQLEEGSVATSYSPYIPSAAYEKKCLLYGDEDVKDTVDFVKGCITRRWGALEMTGNEKFGYTDANNWLTFVTGVITSDRNKALCTHLMNEIGGASQNSFWWDSELKALRFSIQGFTSEEDYVSFFAEQYAKGAPVKIYYPLVTETRETTEAEEMLLDAYTGNTAVLSSGDCFSGTVVLQPQIPSPAFSGPIYPIRDCGVQVKGRNLLNKSLYSQSDADLGISFRNNGDGTYTLNGKSRGLATFGVLSVNRAILFPAGVYRLSGGISNSIYLQLKNSDRDSHVSYDSGNHPIFTLSAPTRLRFNIRCEKDTVCDNVAVKPMIEAGTELHPFMAYKDFSASLQFELYGNGEVNDTCEPCVLVDGEWRCRVIRNLGVYTFTGEEKFDLPSGIVPGYSPFRFLGLNTVYPTKGTYVICSHFQYSGHGYSGRNYEGIATYNAGREQDFQIFLTVSDERIPHNDVSAMREWLKGQYDAGTPVQFVYNRAVPVVELYDPLPLRTIPRYTRISNDAGAEMSAKLKVVDV